MSSISMASIIHPDNATLTIPEMIRSDEYGLKSTVSAKTLSPRTLIPLATPYSLSKEGGRSIFVIKRFREGYYVCSCPAWKFSQERDKFRRSCPHLVQLLGGEYEDERLKVAKEAPSEIWNVESFRRSTSSSSVATRIAQAKAILDGHLASASQGESPPPITAPQRSPETPLAAPVPPAALQPAVGDASKKRSMPMDDSDTETEEEILPVSSQAARPSLSQPAANEACPPQQSNLSRVVTPPSDGPGPGDHPSPSKQSRRNAAEDDKVALLLAKPWILDPDPSKPRTKPMDPAGWWVSEKLDGVRAYWDGQRLYSRQKLEWNAPAWWKNRLPKDITLDGELWIRRGAFDQTSRVCRTTVRMGKLRTFKHFLDRDSLERSWLREQLGGRLASQERLRQEEAGRLSRAGAVASVAGAGGKPKSRWKSHKRMIFRSQLEPVQNGEVSMLALAQLSLRSLLPSLSQLQGSGKAESTRDCAEGAIALPALPVMTCKRCGKCRRSPGPPSSSPLGPSSQKRKRKRGAEISPRSAPSDPVFPSLAPTPRLAAPLPPTTPTARYRARNATISPRFRRRSRLYTSNVLPAWRSDVKKSSEWRNIKYMIFDSPSMSARPVEERWAELAKRFGTTEGGDIDKLGGTEIKLVHHVQCRGREHMLEMLNDVNSKGGEGLMLRRPGSRYEFKRGTTLYKLKSFYDAEAVVVGYADGEGRNANRIGALAVQMENGTVFRVGTGLSDAQRENPPPIGTVINYRFQEISEDGFPRFPSFRGVAWDKTRAKDAIVRPRVGKAA